MLSVLLLSDTPSLFKTESAVHFKLMLLHQFSIASSSPISLDVNVTIAAGKVISLSSVSPNLALFLALSLAPSKISSTLDFSVAARESGGLPMGRQSSDPSPASQASLDCFQASISPCFSTETLHFTITIRTPSPDPYRLKN
jgi:hypothetical protein